MGLYKPLYFTSKSVKPPPFGVKLAVVDWPSLPKFVGLVFAEHTLFHLPHIAQRGEFNLDCQIVFRVCLTFAPLR